jgi:hypothetical protein
MASLSAKFGECALCGHDCELTFHHLIPRRCHSNKWFRKNFSREEMRTRGINVCRPCHRMIHRSHAEKELGRTYNTLAALLESEPVATYVEWARKKRRC